MGSAGWGRGAARWLRVSDVAAGDLSFHFEREKQSLGLLPGLTSHGKRRISLPVRKYMGMADWICQLSSSSVIGRVIFHSLWIPKFFLKCPGSVGASEV